MRRREFLIGMPVLLVALPLAAWSQSRPLPRVGIVGSIGPGAVDALKEGLREAGLVENQSIVIFGGPGNFDRAAVTAAVSDLIAKQVDVIFASGFLGSQIAKDATSSIPIVSVSADPVGGGIVDNLARPGGNVTGLSIIGPEATGKRLDILSRIIPGLRRVAVLYNPDDSNTVVGLSRKAADVAVEKLKLDLQMLAARAEDEFAGVFAKAVQANAQAVMVTPNPVLDIGGRRIAELELQHRLPVISYNETYPKAGGLISYGTIVREVYKRGAYYVSRILAGARPADLPVEQPTKFNLVINLKRAKALDLKMPDTLLASADEVIE